MTQPRQEPLTGSMEGLAHRVEDLATDGTARLAVATFAEDELVLGAFERRASATISAGSRRVSWRVSGGRALLAGPGSLHVRLALPHASALVGDADVPRLVNRHVRPLLRALTRLGATATYLGRDFVTVGRRPAGWVGFAHHAASGRAAFEAIVGVSHAFADAADARWGGHAPWTLEAAVGREVDVAEVERAISAEYERAYPGLERDDASGLRTSHADDRAAWSVRHEAPIGVVGARFEDGDFALGGELVASEDLVDAVGRALRGGARGEAALRTALDAVPAGELVGVRAAELAAML